MATAPRTPAAPADPPFQSMSAHNRDVVRAMFDAFSRRDARALVAVAHPDIVFCPPTRRLAERDEPYRGHDGLRAYLDDVAQVWEELRSEPDEFLEIGDDRVLCTGRVYAWGIGRVVDTPAGWVFRLGDGLVIEGRVFETRRAAYEAVGLEFPRGDRSACAPGRRGPCARVAR